jgi:hypothetical protein
MALKLHFVFYIESRDMNVVFRLQSLLQLYSFLLKSAHMPPPYSSKKEGGGNSSQDNVS